MRRSSAVIILTIGMALSLAACSGVTPGGAQACAGINEVEVAYDPVSGQMDARLCGGKENERVKLSGVTLNGVEFHYEAEGSKAFAGQMTQAEMQQALSRERGETIRELIGALRNPPALIPAPTR
jgi:hypothetical protein